MEGCLRAVPDLVDRRSQDDPYREEFTVPAASGELRRAHFQNAVKQLGRKVLILLLLVVWGAR
jgi:hypothetical protein